jgi:Cytochrome P450
MLWPPSLEQLGISILCLVIAAIVHHVFILSNGPNEPPLVKGPLPFLGCALSLRRDFRSFLMENAKKYGGIYSIYVLGSRIHVLSDPTDGVPAHFRSRNFGFKSFSLNMRRKMFLNTEAELRNDAMAQDLGGVLVPALLSIEGTKGLTERLMAHLQPTLDRLVESMGYEWREVDLVQWCFKLVFELGNLAIMGTDFPRDNLFYRDLMEFDSNLVTVWKNPAFLLRKEMSLAKKLLRRIEQACDYGLSPAQVISDRMQVAQLSSSPG